MAIHMKKDESVIKINERDEKVFTAQGYKKCDEKEYTESKVKK